MSTPAPVLARAAAHVVVRVLALLGLERLLVDGRLDGLLRLVGLYSDDPLGAGLTAFLLIAVVAGVLALVDGLCRLRTTPVRLQLVAWAVVCVAYGLVSALVDPDRSGTGALAVLMAGIAASGAVPGIVTGTAVRLVLTPARRPAQQTLDSLPSDR